MLPFSQRYGFRPIQQVLQTESMDKALRNGLYNCYYKHFEKHNYAEWYKSYEETLWVNFFKRPLNERDPQDAWLSFNEEPVVIKFTRKWLLEEAIWYEVYDLLEFCLQVVKRQRADFVKDCNSILEREMSAYRFVNGLITPIVSESEIEAIEQATQNPADRWKPVTEHLRTALTLFSDRQNPDYRNSVKESISAVEAACKLITGDDKTTLGQALKVLENKEQIHPSFKAAFDKLYGYTSDKGEIRHAMLESTTAVNFDEAKFMLVACSAFVNYLQPHLA